MAKPKNKKTAEEILKEKHSGHDTHLCELIKNREIHKVAKLVKDSKYICLICGRTAAKADSLCLPVEI